MRATWNVLFILGMFTNVLGAQSYLVNYQGQLTDAQGQPLATKGYKLDLRIWDAPNGGAQLWHKTFVNTQVVNGQFNVVLGADDSGVSIADVLYGGDRYLGGKSRLRSRGSSPNFPVKSPYGSPGSVKLLVPPTCFWGGTRFEVPRFS